MRLRYIRSYFEMNGRVGRSLIKKEIVQVRTSLNPTWMWMDVIIMRRVVPLSLMDGPQYPYLPTLLAIVTGLCHRSVRQKWKSFYL